MVIQVITIFETVPDQTIEEHLVHSQFLIEMLRLNNDKKLIDQSTEELNSSSGSKDIDNDISVGSNEFSDTKSMSDVHDNDSEIILKLFMEQRKRKILRFLKNKNDTFIKPKIKSVSNNSKKFTLNHNVKPKTASSTELLSTKLQTTKVKNRKTRSNIQKKQFKPVIIIKEKNLDVLKDVDKKKKQNQNKCCSQSTSTKHETELPISNVELKPTPIPTIDKKDPEPPQPVIKTLEDQSIKELNSSSGSKDIDDDISVGSNEISDTKSMSDVHDNDIEIILKLFMIKQERKIRQFLKNKNDTLIKSKIKSVSNNSEKFTLNHNVKPKTASSTELLSTKLQTTKVKNRKTRSNIQKKQFKPVIIIKEKNLDVLKDVDKKKKQNQNKCCSQSTSTKHETELPISNVELKPTPIPTIDKKDPEPPQPVIKTLKEQLIEELNNSSGSEDIDDDISVGSNEISDTKSMSDVHDNDIEIILKLFMIKQERKIRQFLKNKNDTLIKSKIKSVSNNSEKFTLNHNVKPKTASSTELLSTKLQTTKVKNRKTRSNIQKKQFKPVIIIKEKNLDVLKDVDKKKNKTRTSVALNQLQPNIKVNIQAELPISNVELKPTPIPTIDKKDPEPPQPVIKTLKDQLIEELNNSSGSEDIDDDISVGSNEFSVTYSMSDIHDNDSSNLIPIGRYLLYRSRNNSSAKKTRVHIAQNFDILVKACSNLKTNRYKSTKPIILLAAKKECRLLKSLESKLIKKKKLLHKANAILKNRGTELTE
ncbi:hypothetical protein AGLY_009324 [Aphis glycines]|uniref:Uncharacterized protein n=1 Tax=Aphis glycines TaxID=307491 RepID=A0A6G0TK89_APHGL|nr:hypothetical protein AGLY_009324 [Aphis glycines]